MTEAHNEWKGDLCSRQAGAEEISSFWAGIDSQEKDLVGKVLDACSKGGKYLQFNLVPNGDAPPSGPAMTLYDLIRGFVGKENSHWADTHGVIDPYSTSLILIGGKDTKTAFHMDPCEARNIAFKSEKVTYVSGAMTLSWLPDC
ncbi:hypothetical protein WJX77_005005 [Trebouxia sp. C0004]